MPTNKKLYYRIAIKTIRLFYKKRAFEGVENIPEEPCIIISNHAKIHGPLTFLLQYPRRKLIWSAQEMSSATLAPAYSYRDFWSRKPKPFKWAYKLVAYAIIPLLTPFFRCADCLPVYRDERVFATFKGAITGLLSGMDMIIFPEKHKPYNSVVNEFNEAFVDLGRLYYKRTGKSLAFVPCYNAPSLKRVVFGKPVYYDINARTQEERGRILSELKGQITCIARSLPPHKVVPYENIKRVKYPKNIDAFAQTK